MITPESVNVGATGELGTVGTVGAVGRDRGSSHALITSNRHSPVARRVTASISLISLLLSTSNKNEFVRDLTGTVTHVVEIHASGNYSYRRQR